MPDKVKYVLYSLLDFACTFGGSEAVIVLNYISEDTSTGYKISLSGIILVVALLLTAKAMFEKGYRRKYDTLLQQLAEATDVNLKAAISAEISALKTRNDIYQRMMTLLPFAILYVVTFLGAKSLESLHSTTGLILTSLGAGSVFNIMKKPVAERVSLEKIKRKAIKK